MGERSTSGNDRMKRVNFRLPDGLLDEIDAAVDRGEFPNPSEAIREAVRLRFSPYTKHEVVFSEASNRIRADGSGELGEGLEFAVFAAELAEALPRDPGGHQAGDRHE